MYTHRFIHLSLSLYICIYILYICIYIYIYILHVIELWIHATCGKAELWLFVGFLSLKMPYHNFTELHQSFTGISRE